MGHNKYTYSIILFIFVLFYLQVQMLKCLYIIWKWYLKHSTDTLVIIVCSYNIFCIFAILNSSSSNCGTNKQQVVKNCNRSSRVNCLNIYPLFSKTLTNLLPLYIKAHVRTRNYCSLYLSYKYNKWPLKKCLVFFQRGRISWWLHYGKKTFLKIR